MVGKYDGKLIGYRTYDKDGKKKHIYDVFCEGVEKDNATGLYKDECKVVSVVEDTEAITAPKANMPVKFYGEETRSKNGTFIRYHGIQPAKG